jgi:hypothetical protein
MGLLLFRVFAGDNLTLKIIVQFGAGLMNVIFAGAFAAYMVESFPTRVRMSGISMGNVIGFSVAARPSHRVIPHRQDGRRHRPGIYMAGLRRLLIAVLGEGNGQERALR